MASNMWKPSGIDLRVTAPGVMANISPLVYLLGLNGVSEGHGLIGCDEFLDSHLPHFFFLNPMWTLSNNVYRESILKRLNLVVCNFPQHTYVLLLNDQNDTSIQNDLDPRIGVFVCGEHSLASSEIFNYEPSEIEYSAVYIAQNHPGKRIHLAQEIDGFCLISRNFTQEDLQKSQSFFTNIHCPNVLEGNLSPKGVASILRRSNVGLILSEREGQNRATIEYLLSGLPVVSTPNVGGRDRFLSPFNSIYAMPTPDAVADAVSYLCSVGFSRKTIAENAKQSVLNERRWLSYIVDKTIRNYGYSEINLFDRELPHHGFSRSRSLADFFRERFFSTIAVK